MKKLVMISGSLALLLALGACGDKATEDKEVTKKVEDQLLTPPPKPPKKTPTPEATSTVVFDSLSIDDWRSNNDAALSVSEAGTLMFTLGTDDQANVLVRDLGYPAGTELMASIDMTVTSPASLQLRLQNDCEGPADDLGRERFDLEAGASTLEYAYTFSADVDCVRMLIRPVDTAFSGEITSATISKAD